MAFYDEARTDLKNTLNAYGQPIVLKFYTVSGAAASYNDDRVLTQSGNSVWTSGIAQPLSSKFGSADHVLVEAGRIKYDDMKVYFAGDVFTNGSMPTKIGIGSPTPAWYTTTELGIEQSQGDSTPVYKKAYIRFLSNGSLMGE